MNYHNIVFFEWIVWKIWWRICWCMDSCL